MAVDDRSQSGGGTAAKAVHYEAAGGYLLSGLIIFGALGLVLDRWSGTNFLTPVGLVLGMLLGGYLVYVRIVREPDGPVPVSPGQQGDRR